MGAGPNSDVPGSVNLTAAAAKRLVVQVLTAYGAPGDNAEVVAGHLVDCDLAGVPSHGLIRVPQYVDEILSGEIDPEAKPSVHHVSSARRDIVGHRCFGQVGCARAVGEASALAADHGLGLVTVRETGHAGRIGAYAESLGRMGLLSMVFCSGPRSGHRVSPFNGREGRLATNPIAFSVPTSGEPIVGDFSSAAAPEGRIRYLRNLGEDAPEDTLLDAEGRPSTDPNVLYTTPPGTIMGLGGTRLGHRGFALGLLVEAMATVFAGEDTEDPSRIGNNVTMLAASVDDEFAERADRMARYVVSSRAARRAGGASREYRTTASFPRTIGARGALGVGRDRTTRCGSRPRGARGLIATTGGGAEPVGPGVPQWSAARMKSTQRSASIITERLVLALGIDGIMEASTTLRPSTPKMLPS